MERNLSENAVAVLLFEIKGYLAKDTHRRLSAYRELAAAGIMELVSESEYRFTAWGLEHREEILEREAERIESARYEPPDGDLSESARNLLSRIASGERVGVDNKTRAAFRELAGARVLILGHTFAGGDESGYRFTYWGWKLKDELITFAGNRA